MNDEEEKLNAAAKELKDLMNIYILFISL